MADVRSKEVDRTRDDCRVATVVNLVTVRGAHRAKDLMESIMKMKE
jgi:hypothetical protein